MKHDVFYVAGLLALWSACAGLLWRVLLRNALLALPDQGLRHGLGSFGMMLTGLLAYIPINALFHFLGGSGSSARWALDVVEQIIKRRKDDR